MHSELNSIDQESFGGTVNIGGAAVDAPLMVRQHPIWWLSQLGSRFTLVLFNPNTDQLAQAQSLQSPDLLDVIVIQSPDQTQHISTQHISLVDVEGIWQQRYDAQPGSSYLFRPDQHLTARWRHAKPQQIQQALKQACGFINQEVAC